MTDYSGDTVRHMDNVSALVAWTYPNLTFMDRQQSRASIVIIKELLVVRNGKFTSIHTINKSKPNLLVDLINSSDALKYKNNSQYKGHIVQ